jgi:hypothetical protein
MIHGEEQTKQEENLFSDTSSTIDIILSHSELNQDLQRRKPAASVMTLAHIHNETVKAYNTHTHTHAHTHTHTHLHNKQMMAACLIGVHLVIRNFQTLWVNIHECMFGVITVSMVKLKNYVPYGTIFVTMYAYYFTSSCLTGSLPVNL